MKHLMRIFSVFALVAVIGLMAGCEISDRDGDGGGDGDGDGSSRFNAKTVVVGNSTSHTINLNGEHWFTFFGTGNPVTFETTGNVVDTYMEIYSDDTWAVGASNDNHTTGNLNARVSYNPATSGSTYFIKITQRQSTQGTYAFVVKAE